jgi:hypothetical protein
MFVTRVTRRVKNVMLGLNGEKEVNKNRKIPKGVT